MKIRAMVVLLGCGVGLMLGGHAGSAQQLLAPQPPMGWNSWDAYGSAVTEAEVRANAAAMAKDLKQYGWNYVVVDIQWYEPGAKAGGYRKGAPLDMDEHGRLIPAVNRFPSSANGTGFKPLADYVHSLGLKFGIHILRGVPRQAVQANVTIAGSTARASEIGDTSSICEWNADMYGVDMTKPGAQAYYDSLAALYAQWGVDFIKADDMSRPYHTAEIAGLHDAIRRTGRPMVLSLSPGPAPVAQIDHLRANAEMWRVSDDIWDEWKAIRKNFEYAEAWAPLIEPGHWPDEDMLPLGHLGIRAHVGKDRLTRLTHDEQQTVMTLWAMMRSPLIFGGDIPTLDPFTRSLLTNRRLLALDQSSSQNRLAYKEGTLQVWTAVGSSPRDRYVAVFNPGDEPVEANVALARIGLDGKSYAFLDVWDQKASSRGVTGSLKVKVPAHGSRLFEVK